MNEQATTHLLFRKFYNLLYTTISSGSEIGLAKQQFKSADITEHWDFSLSLHLFALVQTDKLLVSALVIGIFQWISIITIITYWVFKSV